MMLFGVCGCSLTKAQYVMVLDSVDSEDSALWDICACVCDCDCWKYKENSSSSNSLPIV